jgi:AI-2 transport protein TqsA
MELTPDQSRDHFQRVAVMMLGILCVLGLGVVLIEARSLFVPFVMAIFLLYMLNPLITIFENRGMPSGMAGVLTLIIVSGILATLGQVIGTSVQEFALNYPLYEPRIKELTDSIIGIIPGAADFSDPSSSVLTAFDGSSIPALIAALVGSIGGFASEALLVLLILAFMLAGRNQLIEKIPHAFPEETAGKIVAVMEDVNAQIQQYIVAKSLLSFLTATISMLILYLFGIEFVLIWGVLTFVLNFIPNVGSVIATLLPLSLAMIQLDSFVSVLWLGVSLMSVQFLIGNVLDPKFVGDRIGISPVTILFALVAWSWMWGLVGMFLAVPLTVLIKIILENIEPLRFVAVLMGPKPSSTG